MTEKESQSQHRQVRDQPGTTCIASSCTEVGFVFMSVETGSVLV